jgi:DNA polymerase theta
VAAYAAKGVKSLYPWQAGALECGEDGGNLVYCAPTSGERQEAMQACNKAGLAIPLQSCLHTACKDVDSISIPSSSSVTMHEHGYVSHRWQVPGG